MSFVMSADGRILPSFDYETRPMIGDAPADLTEARADLRRAPQRCVGHAADDHADIGRNQPGGGLTNLESRQEVIFVKPLLPEDQMVAQVGNDASAKTDRTYVKENREQLREANVFGMSGRIFHSV